MKNIVPKQTVSSLANSCLFREWPCKTKSIIIWLIISAAAGIGCANKLIQTPLSPLSLITFYDQASVASTFPADGAIDISTSTTVQAVFTNDIEFSSIDSSTFVVADDLYRPIDGSYSYDAASKTVTFTPSSPLLNLTQYNGLITTYVIGPGGKSIAEEKVWYFTTISAGIAISDPYFSPPCGPSYEGAQYVAIQCQDPAAMIKYTINGPNPSSISGLDYGSPFWVSENTVVRAIAYRPGYIDSNVVLASYTIKVMTPILDPQAGSYVSSPNVSITTLTPGATILYVNDGTLIPITILPIGNTFTVDTAFPVYAVATKPNMQDSNTVIANYAIDPANVAAPVFTPSPVMYAPPPNLIVTLSTTTAGATIKYTTDGSNPKIYGIVGTTVAVTDTMTLMAYAYNPPMNDSSVTTATYIIAPRVNSISPNKGSSSSDVPIPVTIRGNNFKAGISAKLTNAGYPDITASSLILVDSGTITCTFDIRGAVEMKWDLVVTNPDGGYSTNLKYFRIIP